MPVKTDATSYGLGFNAASIEVQSYTSSLVRPLDDRRRFSDCVTESEKEMGELLNTFDYHGRSPQPQRL
ncbi:hypothetical protein GX50_04278 [[Emmonsia] crescens]|uniref:Uncharacterized protein n=1 Tax=[Emmonsia] crescens TaxID=73230 RepID=A0A2B7Z927_9EURO|nr:hypothetical protein GX50_04278 [Emmonsia crescens]